ncbi:MAG: alkyl sulfatase dimerization domain-containing protein [Thermodesulfobacteriota bacterium]
MGLASTGLTEPSQRERAIMFKKILLVVIVIVVLGLAGLWFYAGRSVKKAPAPIPVGANKSLVEHSRLFKKGVEKVGDNIYVAIGYGISNSILIEGVDGAIVVDTMTTMEEAAEVLAEFRKITPKPIRAIIYTHSHPDHVFGAEAFAAGGKPEIYAHETTEYHVKRLFTEIGPIIGSRSLRMYGNFLAPGQVLNVGIGPLVGMKPDSKLGFVRPTRTFTDTLEAEAAGIKFKLIHAPGETEDQIVVWLPRQKALIAADNFYWAFPNLYTIRGTSFRDLKQWYQSLDKMRDLNPEHLVPCHTRPIAGAKKIQEILTNYRDAIQYVHDQSLRGINAGWTPDELAERIKLPPHLAEAPYLQPFYGQVSWSARSMFAGNLGWFDGDSATLQPLTRKDQARLMARLAGGEKELLRHARDLLNNQEYQAALQLTGHLIQLNPENQEAKDIRIKALVALGEKEQNPNARHYYLTEALEIRDNFVSASTAQPSPEAVHGIHLRSFMESLAVNLNPKAAADVNQMVGLIFPDANEAFTIHVRHGVAEIRSRSIPDLDRLSLDLKVTADSRAWKEMLAKIRNPLTTLAGFEYNPGNAIAFGKFLQLFAPPQMKRPYEPVPAT